MRKLSFIWESDSDIDAGLYRREGSFSVRDHDSDKKWTNEEIDFWQNSVADFFGLSKSNVKYISQESPKETKPIETLEGQISRLSKEIGLSKSTVMALFLSGYLRALEEAKQADNSHS